MHPKIGYKLVDIVLTGIFISITVILISRLSLSYPLQKSDDGTQSQPGDTFDPGIAGFTKNNEASNSSLSKRTIAIVQHPNWCKLVAGVGEGCNGTMTYKCEFVGNVGLKNHCIRYLMCSKVGTLGVPRHCTSGKHFDFIKLACVNKKDAHCDSSKVCPDDLTVYKVGSNYLQCRDGVPYPRTYPSCPANMAFDQKINRCAAKQGKNGKQFGNNDLSQVLQVKAFQKDDGKVQVQINKAVIQNTGSPTSNKAGNRGPPPNQAQKQVVQVNAYQKQDGNLNIQVNKTQIQNGRTENFNAAGNQQQMNGGPDSNQNQGPNSNQDKTPGLQVRTYQTGNGTEMKLLINETVLKDMGPKNVSTANRQPPRKNDPNSQKQAALQSKVETILEEGIQVTTTPEPNNSTNETPYNAGLTWEHGIPTGEELSTNTVPPTTNNESKVVNTSPNKLDSTLLGPFPSQSNIPYRNQNMGYKNMSVTNIQTQVKVSIPQKGSGKKINFQVNQTMIPAGHQQQIIPNQNTGTSPNQRQTPTQNQNKGPSPNQNAKIIIGPAQNQKPNQNKGPLTNQSAVSLQINQTGSIPNQSAGPSKKQFSYRVQYSPTENTTPIPKNNTPVNILVGVENNPYKVPEYLKDDEETTDSTGSPQVKVKLIQVEAGNAQLKNKPKFNETIIKQLGAELLIDALGAKNNNQSAKIKFVKYSSITSAPRGVEYTTHTHPGFSHTKYHEIPENGVVFDKINDNDRDRYEFEDGRGSLDGGEETTTRRIRYFIRH